MTGLEENLATCLRDENHYNQTGKPNFNTFCQLQHKKEEKHGKSCKSNKKKKKKECFDKKLAITN